MVLDFIFLTRFAMGLPSQLENQYTILSPKGRGSSNGCMLLASTVGAPPVALACRNAAN
jgi:hypothetical protein